MKSKGKFLRGGFRLLEFIPRRPRTELSKTEAISNMFWTASMTFSAQVSSISSSESNFGTFSSTVSIVTVNFFNSAFRHAFSSLVSWKVSDNFS